jgi:cytochrome c oxidase cbb3-type subunit I/II
MVVNIWKTIGKAEKRGDSDLVPAAKIPQKIRLEGLATVFSVLVFLSIVVGSVVEILPTFIGHSFVPQNEKVTPYPPLELAGRDIYVKEGCYVCHSQMVRPMVDETLRYGAPSTLAHSMYDRPFQWGSKRTGPDLAYVGKKYPDLWHYRHMLDPRSVAQLSIMPAYPWLFKEKIDYAVLNKKFSVMKMLGVPYSSDEIDNAAALAKAQAKSILDGLRASGVTEDIEDANILALIAYLQRLGHDPNMKVGDNR